MIVHSPFRIHPTAHDAALVGVREKTSFGSRSICPLGFEKAEIAFHHAALFY